MVLLDPEIRSDFGIDLPCHASCLHSVLRKDEFHRVQEERRHMPRFDGSLARSLDFDNITTTLRPPQKATPRRARLRPGFALLQGPDKYSVLEKRRRAAQIRARHALDRVDSIERTAAAGLSTEGER